MKRKLQNNRYYRNDTLVFYDGNYVNAAEANASLFNQTMHYGNGVFEGIRSYATGDGTRIFKAKEHFERLVYSAKKMHIPLNYTPAELELFSNQLLKKNNLSNAYLRPLVFLDDNMSLTPAESSHLILMAWEWGKYLGGKMLNVMLSSYQRPHPKSCHVEAKVVGHYTNSILATTEAKQQGFDEALLTDQHGFVAEGPGANFFYEKDGKLFTPPAGNILPGITRATVFELAAELNVAVEEKYFAPEELFCADAAFFCGTAAEIIGISTFNNHKFPLKWEETVSHSLQRKYQRRVAFSEYYDQCY